jgi:hypothetical protein
MNALEDMQLEPGIDYCLAMRVPLELLSPVEMHWIQRLHPRLNMQLSKIRVARIRRPKLDKATFSVRLSAEIRARLERAVEQFKCSFSDYIELALLDRLDKDKIK